MNVSRFIASRLRFKGRIVITTIAISFVVMIMAVAISSGFRHEIRAGLSSISGDIQLTPPDLNVLDANSPIQRNPSYLPYIESFDAVGSVVPVVYRAGIVRHDGNIHGVLFKGLPSETQPFDAVSDSVALGISIPKRLSQISGLGAGDRMMTYFVGEKTKVRSFNIVNVHESMLETDDRLVVYADIADLQRIDGWSDDEVSALEVHLKPPYRSESRIKAMGSEIGYLVNAWSDESEAPVVAVSSVSRYPQLFDWLDLIDFNVVFILLLMTLVAGFNMISGLLIMLFENISTIGLLKALGMSDKGIAKTFLSSSAVLMLKGMGVGNAIALLLCLVQSLTHVISLDPANYFVSFVPVHIDMGLILTADIVSFVVIMALLMIPCLFISKVDPADTVRVR